jgi:hypothetical protein
VRTGGCIVLRARLEKGEYKGAYIWLDQTRVGEWVTLHARVSGRTVTVTCGNQSVTQTTKSTKGGIIFYAQPPDEVMKVKNVRVRR